MAFDPSIVPPTITQPAAQTSPAVPEILRFFAIIGTILALTLIIAYGFGLRGSPPFLQDSAGYVVGRDFLNTWFFGKAAFLPDPGRFYDHALYMRWVHETVPQDIVDHLWSYPPSFLLFAAPIGLLPYPLALAVWTGGGLACLYFVVRGEKLRTIAILGSAAALFCAIAGQVSFFMAACLIAALRQLDRRPILAGLLIALCTIKPQMGLLIPVLLIASGRWRVLFAAIAGTLGLFLVTSAIWGFQVWQDYIALGLPEQFSNTAETQAVLTPWSPTITTMAFLIGLTPKAANLIQFAFTGLAALIIIRTCRRGVMDERRIALFMAASVFAAPYLLSHDLIGVTAAALMLASSATFDRTGSLQLKAIVLLPVLQMVLGFAHLPGAALVPVCFTLWLARQELKHETEAAAFHLKTSRL